MNVRRYLSKRHTLIVLSVSFVLGAGVAVVLSGVGAPPSNVSHAAAASSVMDACADVAYRPACYDEEIPKLMDRGYSMEDAFEVTRIVQRQDRAYAYCHVLGHNLSAKETAKDPSKWKDVMVRAPRGICSNGAIHGAFQERFRKESLDPEEVEAVKGELTGICTPRPEWDATPLEQATCSHALGHLAMYVTDAEIHASLDLCDEIAPNRGGRDFRPICYDGAFMQIYQPLEPDDFALIAGKEIETRLEAEVFCSQFSGRQFASCHTESWPLYYEALQEPENVDMVCANLNDEAHLDQCRDGIIFVLTSLSGLDLSWVESYCPATPEHIRGRCFASAASRMMEVDWGNVDDAVEACVIAERHDSGDACYDELLKMSAYTLPLDSAPFRSLCSQLPEPWGTRCFAQD